MTGRVGRDLTEGELRDAMSHYAEDEVRRRVESGEQLDRPLMVIEITGHDDDVLVPYLQAGEN